MSDSQPEFPYTWADVQPIRILVIALFVLQICGALFGLVFADYEAWFYRIWFGGALATFPAFAVGAFIQSRVQPGSIGDNRVMVQRVGVIAAILSLAALFMPELGAG